MALPQILQYPPVKTPFFTKDHNIAEEWQRFFLNLRTGLNFVITSGTVSTGIQTLGAVGLEAIGQPLPDDFIPPALPTLPMSVVVPATLLLTDPDTPEETWPIAVPGPLFIGQPVIAGTVGSVLFIGTAGLAQDNAKFFWDDTNFRLGIGTAAPTYDLDVSSAATAAGTIIRTNNTSSTGTANFYMSNDAAQFILFQIFGSAFAGTLYGINKAGLGLFEYQGTNAFLIGTSGATPVVFGTNRSELARFTSSGFFGINITAPLYKLHVVGPGGSTAGSLAALITDNNSHDGMNFAIGWTGASANNKYKALNIDSNGLHLSHMTDALNVAPTADFSISNAGVCKAETEMQSVLYDFGASTCHLKGDGGDGILHLLDSGETTFSYILLGKTDATGVRIQFNASTGITLVNGNNSLFVRLQCGNLNLNGTVTNYNGIATAGEGVPAIYGSGRSTAQTAAVASVAAYTVGSADGSFWVSANVNVTTSITFSINVQVTYTDETNTAQTLTLNFQNLGGTLLTAITNVQGTGPYEGLPVHLRAKASTAITVKTAGTFTSVTYNVEAVITQIA